MHRPPIIIIALQIILLIEAAFALFSGNLMQMVIALATFGLTFAPYVFAKWVGIRLPRSFIVAIGVFLFATLFLGEVYDYYDRYWWWDVVLHFGSALSFGFLGFLFVFMLFEGDRFAAPPWAIALLSASVALSIGAMWEIFEFFMDQSFGLNMQRSGLMDTMADLIVDTVGAGLSGFAGFLFLKGRNIGNFSKMTAEFVSLNRKLYSKFKR